MQDEYEFPTTVDAYDYDGSNPLDVYRQHARDVIPVVWPGGTLELGENVEIVPYRLTSWKGCCSYKRVEAGKKLARISMHPDRPATDDALDTVRHELIHAWQWIHPDGDPGHGPTFKQWLGDCAVDY